MRTATLHRLIAEYDRPDDCTCGRREDHLPADASTLGDRVLWSIAINRRRCPVARRQADRILTGREANL